MADAVQEFFANLESQADASKTAGMSNSYVFDVEGAGQWKVDVGDVNPTSAYMTGKLKIKGDMGAAMKLQKLF
jgi:putative sterol carrier protein